MAYRRKLTAFFISAAFILTLSLSFFFIAEELSHDHGHGSDPCPICERSICASGRFPSVRLSRSRRTMEDPFPSPIFFPLFFPFPPFLFSRFPPRWSPSVSSSPIKPGACIFISIVLVRRISMKKIIACLMACFAVCFCRLFIKQERHSRFQGERTFENHLYQFRLLRLCPPDCRR